MQNEYFGDVYMFRSQKVLEIITYLLSMNNNKMEKLKLIKELYLIDRLSIEETNMSITGDEYFSLPHGPILSNTLNILNDIQNKNEWAEYLEIEPPYTIKLLKPFNNGMLSKKDMEYVKSISEKYSSWTAFQLRNYTHTLPEWKEPFGSNRKIHFTDIMKALDKDEDEIKEAKEEYKNICELYESLGILQ